MGERELRARLEAAQAAFAGAEQRRAALELEPDLLELQASLETLEADRRSAEVMLEAQRLELQRHQERIAHLEQDLGRALGPARAERGGLLLVISIVGAVGLGAGAALSYVLPALGPVASVLVSLPGALVGGVVAYRLGRL